MLSRACVNPNCPTVGGRHRPGSAAETRCEALRVAATAGTSGRVAEICAAAAAAAQVDVAELEGEHLVRVFEGYERAVRSGAEHVECLSAIERGQLAPPQPRGTGVTGLFRRR